MNIEFRQQCPSCPTGVSDYMCCDGTKIGINLTSASIDPIETFGEGEVILTWQRRYNKTFITNDSPMRKEVCDLIRVYCKMGRGELSDE